MARERIEINVDVAEYVEKMSAKKMTPEQSLWFQVLYDAIEQYLCGVGERLKAGMFLHHIDAGNWIFNGDPTLWNSFESLWNLFFDIDPIIVKTQLKKRFEKKYREYERKTDAETKSNDRGRDSDVGGDDFGRGNSSIPRGSVESDAWFESFIFG